MSDTPEAEIFGPPAPLRLWTYRYWHQGYRQWQTLDCSAVTQDAALASAQRFMRRADRRAKACGFRLQIPNNIAWMKLEGAPL